MKPGLFKHWPLLAVVAIGDDFTLCELGVLLFQVKTDQSEAEPGWLGGVNGDKEGWFPDAYAQPVDDSEQTAIETGEESADDQQFFGNYFGSE